MSVTRSTEYATFTIERAYDAVPERVFTAWASRETKRRWFGDPESTTDEYDLDFRVGGREISRGGPPDGPVYTYLATYQDIVPNQRISFSHTIDAGEDRISVCVSTVEFKPNGAGTQMTYTEQGVFLDGLDTPAQRQHGTGELLDSLAEYLAK